MTKPNDIETCETCIYRVDRSSSGGIFKPPSTRSFCFRYPKTPFVFESSQPRKDDYPQVLLTDWCGEWEGEDVPPVKASVKK